MVEISWSISALNDLEEIAEFIASDSEAAARNYVTSIYTKVNLLSLQPRLGRFVPEFGIEHIREIIFEKYRLVYRLNFLGNVEILMIHHAARDLTKRSIDQ